MISDRGYFSTHKYPPVQPTIARLLWEYFETKSNLEPKYSSFFQGWLINFASARENKLMISLQPVYKPQR